MATAAISLLAPSASAQDGTELPPIVVEGATLDKPQVKVRKSSSGQDVVVPGPAPTSGAAEPDGSGETHDAGAVETVTGVPAKQIGSAVSIVTGAQLEAQQIRHAADALRSLPGVAVSRTGPGGGLTQVRIRGAEANHTLVLIDGIDASDPAGNEFDWANLPAEEIERIEVIRGGQSGIYGSKAIGGVVNVVTKSGKGPITLSARTEFGGYGTRFISARGSGGTDKFWLSVGANYREQNDFNWDPWGVEDDPWDQSTANLRGGATLMKGMTLGFSVRRSAKFVSTDPDFFAPRPQTPFSSAIDAPDYSDQQVFLGGVNLRWDMMDGALTQIFRANRSTSELTTFTSDPLFGGLADNDSLTNTLSYLVTYRFSESDLLHSQHSISAFIEKKEEEFTPTSSNDPGPFTPDGLTRKRGHVATVAEYRVGFYDRVFVGASVRHDDNDTFTDFTTWNVSGSLSLPEYGLRPHARTGTAVALPGMFEQFGSILGQFSGNPDLLPEESYSWDAGVEFTLLSGRATLDVTYFEADLTNEIDGFGDMIFNQLGVSERRGVEVAARVAVLPGLSLGGSYTYLDASEPDGQQEDRRPKHSGRADLNYAFDGGRGNLNMAAIYNGTTPYVDLVSFSRVPLHAYWLFNIAASYKISPEFEVFGRVDNLFDERYEELLGFNTLGIAAYAGVKVTLEDAATAAWGKYK